MMSDNKYKSGKIYKIYNNQNDKFYIGSTIQTLKDRMDGHRKHKRDTFCMSKYLCVNLKDCIIELIENYPCNTEKELLWRERFYFDKYKLEDNLNFLNKMRPIVTKEETKQRQKEYLSNPEVKKRKSEYGKQYRKEHPDKRKRDTPKDKEYKKIYDIKNKDKINSMKNARRQKEKQTNCDCGGTYKSNHKSRHKKTQKHQVYDFLSLIENSLNQ
tara:strand:+ start:1198 stop:1839 length:642 start_codon:yes stop_codon:yes gene_type:complete